MLGRGVSGRGNILLSISTPGSYLLFSAQNAKLFFHISGKTLSPGVRGRVQLGGLSAAAGFDWPRPQPGDDVVMMKMMVL